MAVYITQALKDDKLKDIAEMEDTDDVQMALDALIDAEPKFEGQEFICFVGTRVVIEAGEIVQPRRAFKIKSGASVVAEEEPEADEDEEVEEAPAPKPKRTAKKKPPARKPSAKKAAKKPAAKKGGTRQKITPKADSTETATEKAAAPTPKPGTRAGSKASGKKSPFTKNVASAAE